MAWAGRQAKAGGVGRPAGPSGLNSEEKFFSNKNWIFEFIKALEICRRRFRRNFDMRINFWKVFHMNYNLICIFICTPICSKILFL
jgi:hypothetical protein